MEGVCAMVRSIDPFAHVDSNALVVGNLIRFINQFWYIGDENELNNLISKENIQSVASKIKKYGNLEVFNVNVENS
jgi:hypothetical protein